MTLRLLFEPGRRSPSVLDRRCVADIAKCLRLIAVAGRVENVVNEVLKRAWSEPGGSRTRKAGRSARNDGVEHRTQIYDLAAHCVRGLPETSCPLETEGAGKTGCLLHPRSRVRFAQTKLHTSIQGSWSIPAFPAQWLYGLLRALPGERLFCLRRLRFLSHA